MEEICERENLKAALERVIANEGAPGMDRIPVDELKAVLTKEWPRIKEELFAGTYRPLPVRGKEIPKPAGGTRKLGIPTTIDRFLQQAVAQVLGRYFDPTFSEHSYGFRPGRNCKQAIARAQEYVRAGARYVVDIDLEKFFDRVNHDILMGLLAKRIADKRLLKLIRAFLTAGIMENGLVSPTEEGTPQGGPLSPLLSNVMLDVLDRELESRGLRFARYADDCNIYVASERAGHRVMENITQFLAKKLKLRVNATKSAVAHPWERKFLGYQLIDTAKIHRTVAPQAMKTFRAKVRKQTRRHGGRSVEQMVDALAPFLIGWRGYFGFCDTPSDLEVLDKWVRRRLRAVAWQQWSTPANRHANLVKRGVSVSNANQAVYAARRHSAWHLSKTPALHRALPNDYFKKLGLPSVAPPRPR
jgi:RNA-directed DNA polymerase